MNIDALIFWASVIGTIAFSISGALIAIECKLDILGVIMLGALTACGGGILRDIMLHTKMGIFEDPFFITLSAIVSLLVFIAIYFYLIESIGLSYAFAVISTVLLVLTIRFLSYYFELGLPRVKFKKND